MTHHQAAAVAVRIYVNRSVQFKRGDSEYKLRQGGKIDSAFFHARGAITLIMSNINRLHCQYNVIII